MQSVVVVGAGLSGICIGIKLKQAGIHDFVILEKAQEVGGTWRENQYPGVACDVPSHLYSYSFEQNPEWSKTYSCGQEIQDYCVRCTDKYDIRQHIRFGVEIKQGTFDGQCWRLTSSDGDVFASQALVLAIGGLHTPSYPEIKGLSGFEGRMFHSAKWDTQYDVQDKSVAIIGSAASAVQIVPGIVDRVKSLQVFQRTANWILPRHEKVYSAWAKALFRYVPGLQRAYRWLIYWLLEWRVSVFLKPGSFWSRTVRRLALAYLEE
ncbi:MAG: flavin-containing monooxygenase, partial [Gammaproteobacteria bacterium]